MENRRSSADAKTLLEWACRQHPDSPRKRIKQWIADGRFRLDGEVVTRSGLRLADPGGRLSLGQADSSASSWEQRKTIHPKLTVLHLDASLAIVDKAAGLLSVPAEGHHQPSVPDLLAEYLNNPKGEGLRRRIFGQSAPVQPLPVHRLDQYTSGLLCVAMNPRSRVRLIDQVRSHELLREYLAFADGEPANRQGLWKDFLKLDERGYRQRLVNESDGGATEARTAYEVVEVFSRHHVSKLRLRLKTGLKHQIRIQAAHHDLPLLGDRVYHRATRKALQLKDGKVPYGCRRQALHAAVLGLRHPEDGRSLRFESQLPGDLKQLESRLRQEAEA